MFRYIEPNSFIDTLKNFRSIINVYLACTDGYYCILDYRKENFYVDILNRYLYSPYLQCETSGMPHDGFSRISLLYQNNISTYPFLS